MKKLAIIVPYRNRPEHLKKFLTLLPAKLDKFSRLGTSLNYEIFVIEQGNNKPFNRGKLLNVGFSLVKERFDYFCFHDVDMIPVVADYSYVDIPTHLAAHVSQFEDRKGTGLPFFAYFGGVVLFNKEDFTKVNGFSNEYWGYGLEDTDLLARVFFHRLKWTRRSGTFESLPHEMVKQTPEFFKNYARYEKIIESLNQGILIDQTGLSDLTFTVQREVHNSNQLFHFYSVDI